jgi:putative intracellular protease/amidase
MLAMAIEEGIMAQETVHLAVYDTMADWEVGLATAHINGAQWQRQPGRYRVVTVGSSTDPVTTMGGMRILPDVVLDELKAADSAMLILPGADGWLTGAGNAPFAAKARDFLAAGVPVAAICGATAGLAREGSLDDHDHTSNAAEFLAATGYQGGGRYRDQPAVTDGDLITGSGISPAAFARHILARLDVYTPEVLDAWYSLYGNEDPSGYPALMAATAQ